MVLHFVSKILKEVVPLMEHPSLTFLAGLEEDLINLIMKHGQLVWSPWPLTEMSNPEHIISYTEMRYILLWVVTKQSQISICW